MRCSEHAPRARPLLHTTFAPSRLSAVPVPVARVAELGVVRRLNAHQRYGAEDMSNMRHTSAMGDVAAMLLRP
jgi:hypothetical protein